MIESSFDPIRALERHEAILSAIPEDLPSCDTCGNPTRSKPSYVITLKGEIAKRNCPACASHITCSACGTLDEDVPDHPTRLCAYCDAQQTSPEVATGIERDSDGMPIGEIVEIRDHVAHDCEERDRAG